MDLADYAKRESKFKEAKLLFKLVSYLQPYAYQGWLEYAKMEEECGNQNKSKRILHEGLKFSSMNENLFIKAVKVEVRDGFNTRRRVSLRVQGRRDMPLTRVGEPLPLAQLEQDGAELARFLNVNLEGL